MISGYASNWPLTGSPPLIPDYFAYTASSHRTGTLHSPGPTWPDDIFRHRDVGSVRFSAQSIMPRSWRRSIPQTGWACLDFRWADTCGCAYGRRRRCWLNFLPRSSPSWVELARRVP